jgi:GT2 family glycosyltransferase
VTPRISVIVLNYNGRQWLGPCLEALLAQRDAPDYEVLVVDNGSSDGSLAYVAESFVAVRTIDNGRNLGFAAGNNAGARAARGAVLAFLNNDTVPALDWLARLYSALIDRTLVTSRLVSLSEPIVIDSAGDGYLRAGGAYKHGHGAPPEAFLKSREVFGVCGAAFMIHRSAFEALNGFDEDFFMVYEDVDLSYRARLAGYKCWYEADAVVRHAGSGTLGTLSAMAVYYGQRNLEWVWLKNTPRGLLVRTLASHLLYSIAGIAYYVVRGRGVAALKGKIAALAGLPGLLSKRRSVQEARCVDAASVDPYLTRGWMTLKRAEKSPKSYLNGRGPELS